MKQVVVYPRGFLGYDIGLPVQKQATDLTRVMADIRYNKVNVSRDRTVISNEEIEKLFKQHRLGDRSIASMGFREKVLVAALAAFGTASFFDWCKLQQDSPYFTDMHRRFLNDTFKFIATGERSMNTNTWNQIIAVRPETAEDRKTAYLYQDFFKIHLGALVARPAFINQTVVSWVSQPGGFEDMLATLNILFGKTPHDSV